MSLRVYILLVRVNRVSLQRDECRYLVTFQAMEWWLFFLVVERNGRGWR